MARWLWRDKKEKLLKQEKSEENKVIKLNNRSKNKKRWYKNIKISFYTTLLSTP